MKKAIFIDRDGTLIHEVGYLKMINDLRFTVRAVQALEIFHELGYLNIVITNQSAVARGILSPKELNKIHQRMKTLAREERGTIDAIYFCPHLAEGRIAPYNVECDCRKPKPGMLLRAAEKFRLDLAQCYMIGDKPADLELAANAGVKPVLVLTGYGAATRESLTAEVPVFENLFEFARSLKASASAQDDVVVS
jgi:D-glycero-D-manno-heptose 1,7-bisphosphate phosphatase